MRCLAHGCRLFNISTEYRLNTNCAPTEAGANEAILGRCHAFLIELFHNVSDFFSLGRFLNLTNENEWRRPALRRYTKVISIWEIKPASEFWHEMGKNARGSSFHHSLIIFARALLPFDLLAHIITPL